jgi:hypothetical protein
VEVRWRWCLLLAFAVRLRLALSVSLQWPLHLEVTPVPTGSWEPDFLAPGTLGQNGACTAAEAGPGSAEGCEMGQDKGGLQGSGAGRVGLARRFSCCSRASPGAAVNVVARGRGRAWREKLRGGQGTARDVEGRRGVTEGADPAGSAAPCLLQPGQRSTRISWGRNFREG